MATACGHLHVIIVLGILQCGSALKVLLFWAVDGDERTKRTVKKNVAYARSTGGPHCCDVFLAHYAGKRADWGSEWYDSEVADSLEEPGFKFHLMQKAYANATKRWEDAYEFVWALDSDIDFTESQLFTLFEDARQSQASIIGPTFLQKKDFMTYSLLSTGVMRHQSSVQMNHQATLSVLDAATSEEQSAIHILGRPDPRCTYRYTNFVELTAPMLHRSVYSMLLKDCVGCIGQHAEWGLDRIWCRLAETKLEKPNKACAMLDKASVTHLDWKKATVTRQFHEAEVAVRNRYHQFWSSPRSLNCVSPAGSDVVLEKDNHLPR
mmetsp:Transcript_96182/g.170750  ORF Transcript_96182/g.170750 Transcript_96182/m.170750 type:complete len:322 (-) Transcript_96182:70-1035(-)